MDIFSRILERRRNNMSPRWFVFLALMGLLLPSSENMTLAQPTFDECKIFLVASDTARDLTLNRQPEYIRFLNLVARTYLMKDDFTTFDNLPTVLQDNYNTFAGSAQYDLDISAAAFGQPSTEEKLKALRAFCDETARLVATLMLTQSPTSAPSAKREATGSPTIQLSFDQDTSSNTENSSTSAAGSTLLTGPSNALDELPVECRRGMFVSDIDHDGYLTPMEYAAFVNQYSSTTPYPHSMEFDKLPQELKSNFYRLADDGLMNIFGAVPNQWTQASKEQRSFLQLICYRTEDALEASSGARKPSYSNNTETVTPATPDSNQSVLTLSPRPSVNMNNLGNATAPPTNPSAKQRTSNDNSRGHSKRHVVAAAVGSTLVVLVGLYLAKDKQSTFQVIVVQWFKKQRMHRTKRRIVPFHENSNKEECSPTSQNSNLDDLDSTEENTGFLEDFRVGNGMRPLDEEDDDVERPNNRSSSSSSVYNFQPIRFNPDDFIIAQPPRYATTGSTTARYNPDDFIEPEDQHEESSEFEVPELTPDEENSINANFQEYRFDYSGLSCDDSSATSIYCSSVADDKVLGNRTPANQKPLSNSKQSETDVPRVLSPCPKRRPINTMYQASRFGVIAHSETKLGLEGISSKLTSTSNSSRKETASFESSVPCPSVHKVGAVDVVVKQTKPAKENAPSLARRPTDTQTEHVEIKTPKAANRKIKKVKKRSNTRNNSHSNSTRTTSSARSHVLGRQRPIQMLQPASEKAPQTAADSYGHASPDAHDSASHDAEIRDAEFQDQESLTPSFAFSYGGKSYCIDSAKVSQKLNEKVNDSEHGRMQSAEISTEQQLQHDSISESTSFLSDDFSEDGNEALKPTNPPFRRPNLTGTAGAPFQRPSFGRPKPACPLDPRRIRKTSGKKDTAEASNVEGSNLATLKKVEYINKYPSLFDESDSKATDDISLSDSRDGDSTYEGRDSYTSNSFIFSEACSTSTSINTSEGDPVESIYRLVPIVLPTEKDKIPHMLEQYHGRETELLKTLKRLEIRMKARQSVGKTIRLPVKSCHSEQSQRITDFDMSSSNAGSEEDYSQDSTYYEDDKSSSSVGFSTDGGLSVFSGV